MAARAALLLLLPAIGVAPVWAQAGGRYQVEETVAIETHTVAPRRAATRVAPEAVSTRVEGNAAFGLEWTSDTQARIGKIQLGALRVEPSVEANAAAAVALAAALVAFEKLGEQTYTGGWPSLPVLPLGEAEPPWQTAWLQWAQAGRPAGADDPLAQTGRALPAARYTRRLLRTEFRREVCWVWEVNWLLPPEPAPAALAPELAETGLRARLNLAARSLEWVGQQSGRLIYAERVLTRETLWEAEGKPAEALQNVPLRYRLGLTLRLERQP